MSLLFSTGLMKWRLCIAIAEPQQSYPAAKCQKQTQIRRDATFTGILPETFRTASGGRKASGTMRFT